MPKGLIHTPVGKNSVNDNAISNVLDDDCGSDCNEGLEERLNYDADPSNAIGGTSIPLAGTSNPIEDQSRLSEMKLCVTNTPVHSHDVSHGSILEQMAQLRLELDSLRAKPQAPESTPCYPPDSHPSKFMRPPLTPLHPVFDKNPYANEFTQGVPLSPRISRPGNQSRPSLVVHWNIRFTGRNDHLTAEEFLHRVELRAQDSGVSLDELCSNIVSLLQADALEWYWSQFRHYCRYPTWKDFKELFLSQYREFDLKFNIFNKMLELNQGNDSFDDYYNKMNTLHNRLQEPMNESDYVKILIQNLNTRLGPLVIGRGVNSVYVLRQTCIEAERWYAANRSERKLPYKVHEVEDKPENAYEYGVEYGECNSDMRQTGYPAERHYFSEYPISSQVEELRPNINSNVRKVLTCWNCQQVGHTFHDCPSEKRRVFCYRCGKPGVVTPKCQFCNSGNRQEGTMNRGITYPGTSNANLPHSQQK